MVEQIPILLYQSQHRMHAIFHCLILHKLFLFYLLMMLPMHHTLLIFYNMPLDLLKQMRFQQTERQLQLVENDKYLLKDFFQSLLNYNLSHNQSNLVLLRSLLNLLGHQWFHRLLQVNQHIFYYQQIHQHYYYLYDLSLIHI